MKSLPVVEVKSHFSALLAEVARGEEIAITRHGRVVARLVPNAPIPPQMAIEVFRPLWDSADIDLEAPADPAPEPVATPD